MIINEKYFGNLISMVEGMVRVWGGDLKTLIFDRDNNPRYKSIALSRPIVHNNIEFDDDYEVEDLIVNEIYAEGDPLILSDDAIDLVSGGDNLEDYLDEVEVSPRNYSWRSPSAEFTLLRKKDVLAVMEYTAKNDFSQLVLRSPLRHVCFPWLGKADYSTENIGGVTYYTSTFPSEDDNQNYRLMYDIKAVPIKMKKTEEVVIVEDVNLYVPKMLKSKIEAIEVLKSLNIFSKKALDVIMPEVLDLNEMIEYYMKFNDVIIDQMSVDKALKRRTRQKLYLPGFQGILDDPKLLSELKALFGGNAYFFLSGTVHLTSDSAKFYLDTLQMYYRECAPNHRALIMFLISLIMDTVVSSVSDSWFTDKLNSCLHTFISSMSSRNTEAILPVAVMNEEFDYTEVDMFE
jgi:hypothetical protein